MFIENICKIRSNNKALLNVTNYYSNVIEILGQYDECDGCELQPIVTIPPREEACLIVDTRYNVDFRVVENEHIKCNWSGNFIERYHYTWSLRNDNCRSLPYVEYAAPNQYIPLALVTVVVLFLIVFTYTAKWIWNLLSINIPWNHILWNLKRKSEEELSKRLLSLDVLRGCCILLMIFINNGGGGYWFFQRSVWDGMLVGDIIFPVFLWIVGFSLCMFISSQLKVLPKWKLWLQILKRSASLLAIGILLDNQNQRSELKFYRIFGVLQRIALSYLIVGSVEVAFAGNFDCLQGHECVFIEIASSVIQWFVMSCLVGSYAAVIFMVPAPGCPAGYMGPGGLQLGAQFQNCTGGIVGYVDNIVLGSHIGQECDFALWLYRRSSFEAYGILGTATASFNIFLGVHAGRILLSYRASSLKMARWIIYGILFGLSGAILCGFRKVGGIIPINRHLHSLSLVLSVSGIASILHAFLYIFIEKTSWNGSPFLYPGKNTLLLYIMHCLFNIFPFNWTLQETSHSRLLILNLWSCTLYTLIAYALYRKRVYFRV